MGNSGRLRAGDPACIGPFRTVSRLGRGGEGRVYLASSPRTGPVAVKVRRTDLAERPATCRAEFELGSRVDPTWTAAPIEHGVCDSGPYLATALLDGFGRIRPTSDTGVLWALAGATASALAAIHAAGIVHCDVKPGNVLARDGEVRLIDFGIARDLCCQPAPGHHVQCSRGWAAPEQLQRGLLTTAVDVFSWGCLTAYLATGESPFASETEQEWVMRVRSSIPDVCALPDRLATLVRSALRRDPRQRPAAAEIAAECASVINGQPGGRHRRKPSPQPTSQPVLERTSAHFALAA